MGEKEFRKNLLSELKDRKVHEKLQDELRKELASVEVKIDGHIKVPYDVVVKVCSKAILEARHYDQDIIFYSESDISEEENHNLSLFNTTNPNILIPYLILETKDGCPSSHEVITYSDKAQRIKSLFPFSRYFLIVRGGPKKRLTWHGKNFDEVHHLKSSNPSEWNMDALVKKLEYRFLDIREDIRSWM